MAKPNAKPNAALAKIHIARQQLGMDDATYRIMLHQVAGVRSSKDLDQRGVDKVMAHLERIGFKPKPAAGKARRPAPPADRVRLMHKIESQLAGAGRSIEYADSMARHMFKVDKVSWLKPDQLRRIVAALAYDAKRRKED